MIEIILGLIIVALLGALVYERKEHNSQVKDLTNKIAARNFNEYLFLDKEKKPIKFEELAKKNAAQDSDLVEISEVSDEEALSAAEKTAQELRKK